MPTNLYHRLEAINYDPRFFNGRSADIYHVLAEKAGCSVKDIVDLAYSGRRSVEPEVAHMVISALSLIQGVRIGNSEMSMLFSDDDATKEQDEKERNKVLLGLRMNVQEKVTA